MSKRIVLLTSGQPTLNPRLVKEADALYDAGYEVIVLYAYYNDWATQKDMDLLATKKWKWERVGGSPYERKWIYLFSKFCFKIAQMLTKFLGFTCFLGEVALSRVTLPLIKAAGKYRADLYIAHNLGALPAAKIVAKKHNAFVGFDAEDYHRFEIEDDQNNSDVQLKTFIENKYIPGVHYLSTASPLISNAYRKKYPQQNPITILNVFGKQEIHERALRTKKLKLFWFSQTIGKNRGLEEVITILSAFPTVELHLLGNHDENVIANFRQLAGKSELSAPQLYFYNPIAAEKIFQFASQFDIGLAAELSTPKNRDLCLTNKIFTYAQAGLAVLGSSTTAQKDLLKTFPNMGELYSDQKSIKSIIQRYIDEPEILKKHQLWSKKYATETLNWEVEREKFLEIITTVLEKKITF